MSLQNAVPAPTLSHNETVDVLPQSPQLICLMTTLRDVKTIGSEYVRVVDKIGRQLVTTALNHVPMEEATVTTATNSKYTGLRPSRAICAISILRAGASLEQAVKDCWEGPLSFGKILIQRDEETCLPTLLYTKFPANLSEKVVLVLEPMLATGGSACKAITEVLKSGVPEENIIFVNFISSRNGLDIVTAAFPKMKIVTAAVDEVLNERNHIVPGLGDFGDRYYNTE